MKVYAVLVTYGNRYHLLKEVLSTLLKMKISKVIIINNNMAEASHQDLSKFIKKHSKKITLLNQGTNTGSAKGYKTGIEFAVKQKDCEYIWLLDDDNKPYENALNELFTAWKNYGTQNNICLASFREDRPIYKKAVDTGNPNLVLGTKNMYRSFHMIDTLKKIILKKTKNKIHKNADQIGKIAVTTYGGMFFHKELIDQIGLPDEDYYLYVDDHEFSYRITDIGSSLLLVPESKIEDIEKSWHVKSNSLAFIKIAKNNNFTQLFYTIRNRILFEKKALVNNYIMYGINIAIYTVFVIVSALIFFRLKNIKIYLLGLFHGLRGKEGIHKDFVLK